MVKRKATLANGEVGSKKRKAASAEQPAADSSGPHVLEPLLLKGGQDIGKAIGRGTGQAKRAGKAKRLHVAAQHAAEAPLPEPEAIAAQPWQRNDASGAAAAVGLPEAAEVAFRNREKVLLLSSRGITHRRGAAAWRRIVAVDFPLQCG